MFRRNGETSKAGCKGEKNTVVVLLNHNEAHSSNGLSKFSEYGYHIQRTISRNGDISAARSELQKAIKEKEINQVLLMAPSSSLNGYADLLKLDLGRDIKVKLAFEEYISLGERARIRDILGIPLHLLKMRAIADVGKTVKRVFDVVVSLFLIVVFLPVFVVVAIAIKLGSKGEAVIFKQKRALARGAKEFDFYKFRSMDENADAMKDKLLQQNESNGALFKIKNDPRVTKVGKFIRKWSIDELPQLFNVLKGDMSLVGPRPLPSADFDKLSFDNYIQRYYSLRANAKPGITGLWQVSGRSRLNFEQMVLLDLYYIENHSFFFDLEILLKTISAVIGRSGAY
ncbi:exopolysaccharide biosynthesis polyprenyl glycosylphosphotransferase [candidate division KSB1 bacterium]|nr:exopolysaccharide biosynthesis polyprenyl glycosylphosphotransferase [candidate division KSB1 bacterium]